MFQDVERYVDFIIKNNLTQPQFLMLYLIYKKKYDCINNYKQAVPTEDGSMIGAKAKQDLIDRGFIKKINDEGKADSYMITEKFHKLFIKDQFAAADEFWDMYPGFVKIQGTNTPLTNMDRYAFANLYAIRIDYNVDEHIEVMKDLEFGVRNELIRTSIDKFVRSEGWRKIREIRLNKAKIQEVNQLSDDF